MHTTLLLTLAGLVAVASAGPAYLVEPVQGPVGALVHATGSSVSHQSHSVVHSSILGSEDVLTPVLPEVDDVRLRSAAIAPVAVLPPTEISYHGAPLLRSLALGRPLVALNPDSAIAFGRWV